MKSTGIVKKPDNLGRIIVPLELRKSMGLLNREAVEILTGEGCIILRKYHPACIFCGEVADVMLFNGKQVCRICALDISKAEN